MDTVALIGMASIVVACFGRRASFVPGSQCISSTTRRSQYHHPYSLCRYGSGGVHSDLLFCDYLDSDFCKSFLVLCDYPGRRLSGAARFLYGRGPNY